MNLERRLRALEAKLITEPVVLQFANGSMRELHGPGDFVLLLFRGISGGDLNPTHAAQLDLIRHCVHSEEPGGGHMIELLKCLLHAQDDTGGSVAPVGS
jgi:hypothetical protein